MMTGDVFARTAIASAVGRVETMSVRSNIFNRLRHLLTNCVGRYGLLQNMLNFSQASLRGHSEEPLLRIFERASCLERQSR